MNLSKVSRRSLDFGIHIKDTLSLAWVRFFIRRYYQTKRVNLSYLAKQIILA
jgi:hypothetical protein